MEQTEMFDLPKSDARKLGPLGILQKVWEVSEQAEGLLTPTQAGSLLGISRQGVSDLARRKKLEGVSLFGVSYITARSVKLRLDLQAAGIVDLGGRPGLQAA